MTPEVILDVATGVCSEVRRRYAGYVEYSDLLQESHLWVQLNPKRVRDCLEMEDRDRDAYVARALRNRLVRYAEKARAAALGYRWEDVAWYSRTQVEEMLAHLWDREAWLTPPREDGPETSTRQDPAIGSNWLAGLADVADAFAKLPIDDQTMIRCRYEDGATERAIGELMGYSQQQVSVNLSRAIDRMHRHLGGDRPEYVEDELVGQRRAMTNAHAQAITGQEYDG